MDLAEGPDVDIVLEDPWRYPMDDDSCDAVISGQMLEHNEFFWLSFLEMARVLKMAGLMIHIAPSRGLEHRDPQDCWRVYRDGLTALAKWAGFDCIEATTDWAPEHFDYIDSTPKHARRAPVLRQNMRSENTVWGDTVGVFVKTHETRDTRGMDYIRRFAALHTEAPEALRHGSAQARRPKVGKTNPVRNSRGRPDPSPGTAHTLPMRRPLVGERDRIARLGLALGLAVHQHLDPPGEPRQLAILAREHVRKLLDRLGQMRHHFFQRRHTFAHDRLLWPGFLRQIIAVPSARCEAWVA